MRRSYGRAWAAIAAGLLLWVGWIFEGRALARRLLAPPRTAAEEARTEERFLAILLPKITRRPENYTMSADDLDELLAGLAAAGYTSLGLDDVRRFYKKGRRLPPKAVIIGFDRDQPASVALADGLLRRHRMRAVVFLNKARDDEAGAPRFRQALTAHQIRQMRRSGAWDFGATAQQDPGPVEKELFAALDDGRQHWTRDPSRFPVRFEEAKSGYNDSESRMAELRVFRVRGERGAGENLRMIHGMWPRALPFEDDFAGPGLGLDWVADWGVVSGGNGRLAVIPTPRQRSASVFLSGTEDWRDAFVELELAKQKGSFWVYLRYENGDRYVRVGLKDGGWVVQQKAGAGLQPVTLGRAPALGPLPARVRLVVKDEWAILHVDGRMQFGKGVRLSRTIARGRLQLTAYDPKTRSALGVVTRLRAGPLEQRWIALDLPRAETGPDFYERLRQEAVTAHGISPRWLSLSADGRIEATGADREFVRALAGFNRCLLAPLVDASASAGLPSDDRVVERLQSGLAAAAVELDAAGLNVRLSTTAVADPTSARFLAGLAKRLRVTQRRLWVTVDGPAAAPMVDAAGWLRVSTAPYQGAELLDAYRWEAAKPSMERSRLWN